MERRRRPRGPTFRPGMRVEVTGPFHCRTGTGTVRYLTVSHAGLVVDLDSGKDVLVARRFAQPLVDTSSPT